MRISDWSSDVCSSDLPFSAERLRKVKPFSAERLRKVKPCSAERLKDVKPCSAERLRKVKPCSAAFPSCRTRSGIQRAANSPVAALAGRLTPERVRGDGEIGGTIGRAHVCTPVTNAHLV